MKRKLTNRILSVLLAAVMLTGILPTAVIPAFAADLVDRNTISSVAITVDKPVAGQPLSTCVPATNLCQITYTWSVRGLKGFTEIPASTIAKEGTTYYLAMVLTPNIDLYTFATSVTGTVNGKTVTVGRISNTKIACMATITPLALATEVEVSVPQPAYGATPGTPTAADGRTVTDYKWYRNHPTGLYDKIELGEDDVFTGSYTYWMEATVKASSNEVFDENTTVTVNGQVTTILSRDLESNTITFRYDVSEIINVAANIYVPDGNGGYWYLTHGDTKTNAAGTYTASYVSGILTLTNTGDSTVSGFYQIPNQTWYVGIYADNNLTVRFEGDFHFDLGSVPEDAAYVYGIYVAGDLTIINRASFADRTVSFVPAEGVLATHGSSGIYCDLGGLTVKNESQKGFTLNAYGVGVRLVDGRVTESANFTNHGIYAAVSITIGDNCTVNATAADVALSSWGTTTSRGIYCYSGLTIGNNAVVTATGGNINPSQSATNLNLGNYQYCYGVHVRAGNITVNGGTLIVTGGNIDYGTITGTGNMGLGQECYGIYCNDSVTLNGGTITATAGYSRANDFVESSLSRGIFCSTLTVSSGAITATANDAWLESTGLWVQGVLNQTGGTITGTGGVAVCLQGSGSGSKGIYVINTLIASGGSLTGTGGTMGIQQASVGLQAGKIELSGTAQVTGYGGFTTTDAIETPVTGASTFASYPGDSIGVWTFDDLKVDGNAVLTATGGTVRGNRYSAAYAESVGLKITTADDCTISGSGKIVATGGETHYGGKGNNYSDSSCGIYGEVSSLIIDAATVIATGGNVSTQTTGGGGVTKGGVSYGLYLPGSSLTLQNGAELTATGGDNPTYSDNYTQISQINNSYGAYVGGDITVTDSVLTATGGLSIKTVGLYNGGAVTLNGSGSRLTAVADTYYEDAPGAGSEQYSYGAMNGDGNNPGGAYTVNGGIILLQGQELAMKYQTNSTLTAAAIQRSSSWDGSDAVTQRSPADFSAFYNSKYVKADSDNVYVTIPDWTYGDAGYDPSYTTYEGEPTILWTGTTNAGASYSSENAPTEAGSYTVTVTYPGGETGSANFTVKPRPITTCSWNRKGSLTYNGGPQSQGITIKYADKELVEGIDYTLSGNTATNADTYTMTITGIGNFTGTKTGSYTIGKKTPTAEDFNIPVIGEYAYTGERVELPLPTLKEPYTGGGTIALLYDGQNVPPSAIGEYTVTFSITEGTNFAYANNIEYGTLVIKAADISAIALNGLDAPLVGKAPDTKVKSAYPALYTELNVRWLDEENAVVNSFEEGKFYTVEITVAATYIGDGSDNRFNFADSVTATIDGIAITGDGNSVTINEDDTVTIRYKFPEAAAVPEGFTVSGTVTSSGSETDDITIALFADGSASADYTVTVKGNTAVYSFECVANGTYTMKVNKHGHISYTTIITVGDTDLVHNVNLKLYQFGQTVQIRLIEPWGLKANARVHDGILANIDYSTLYSYGVYFIRASKLDREGVTAETITIADIIEDSDATHMTKGNGVTVENSGGQDRLTAIYDKGLYTYEFSDSVYVLFYIKPTESGEPVYAAIRERNLSQLVSQRKDQTSSFSAKERSVYLYMEKLEDDILSYRSDFVNPGVSPEQTAPTLEENPLSGSIASSSKYSFGHKVQVSLIEPWGIRLKARVYTSGMTSSQSIDYGELQDYGVIVLMDNNTTGFDTAEELLSRTDAYIFSASNGDVELEGNMIAANFTKDVYTYLLNSDFHVMFYVKDDDGYHFGPIKVRNLYELMLDRKEDTTGSYSEKEKLVYQDMVDLYTAITAYRASLAE